jgi:hypothetical protein
MLHRLRHETRILGIGTFGMPVLVVAVFLGVGLLAAYDTLHIGGTNTRAHQDLALGLLFLIEFGLPPVAGIVAANMVSGNPAVELHLALRRSYAGVVWLRLLLFAVWVALACVVVSVLVRATGYWIAPQPAPLNQLSWAAPALWFIGAGAMLSLLLRSRIASGAILGMLWLGELVFRTWFLQNTMLQKAYLFLTLETLPSGSAPDAPYWVANRLTLLALSVVFLVAVVLLLRRNEALLGHEA